METTNKSLPSLNKENHVEFAFDLFQSLQEESYNLFYVCDNGEEQNKGTWIDSLAKEVTPDNADHDVLQTCISFSNQGEDVDTHDDIAKSGLLTSSKTNKGISISINNLIKKDQKEAAENKIEKYKSNPPKNSVFSICSKDSNEEVTYSFTEIDDQKEFLSIHAQVALV